MIATSRRNDSFLTRCWPVLLIGAVWLWMFWPMISGQTVVGFRDSAYFYYPWFKWIDQQWAAGELPLWNPWCDLGHPVVADGTSSIFYPGKLIFWLRFLEFPARYGIYIAGHVLLAAIGAFLLCRRMGANTVGATLASVSYAFGGSVLFQSTNVVYLVSAALLPFALANLWMMFRVRSNRYAVQTGLFCALMILGGDPQMAYFVGLMAVGLWLGTAIRFGGRGSRLPGLGNRLAAGKILRRGSRQLAILGCVAVALSAIQLLPTYIWATQSVRYIDSNHKWQTPGQLPPGSAVEAVYQFSQPPWTLAELLWPNVLGKNYPVDRRWGDKLPGADRIWTPSLYLGLMTCLLALSALRMTGRQRRRVWLTRMMIFFGCASFGWYGVVWLWNEFAAVLGLAWITTLDPSFGGVYWMMVRLLPGFGLFRYPAKLFVVASLAVCILAGLRLSSFAGVKRGFITPTIWPAVAVLLVSAIGLCCWPLTASMNGDWVKSNPGMFGPFDFDGARMAMLGTLLHTFVAAGLYCLIVVRHRRAAISTGSTGWPILMVLATVIELLIANSWLVPQVDQHVLESPAGISFVSNGLESSSLAGVARVIRDPFPPNTFYTTRSRNRLEQIIEWQRNSLHPKHNLTVPVGVVGSFSSIENPINTEFAMAVKQQRAAMPVGRDGLADGVPIFVAAAESQLKLIESVAESPLSLLIKPRDRNRGHDIQIIRFTGNGLQLSCSTSEEISVFVGLLPCPGWTVKVIDLASGLECEDCRIEGGNFFLAARVPAGKMRVEFNYIPLEFWIGFWISLIAWLTLMAAGFRIYSHDRADLWIGRRRFRSR